ncbi:AAA family ATPase [Terribacillus saccharophilus]|uniref:ATPase dynein-related AAA domain-containing protein n=1 Tax=Terribacillus saccharophilus TaxID=361277 RepID=A0A268A7T5_9BACI|nr:AAA family ATPase [Terribacillus saccharophilus]PAD20174.1 hypothetical protein CHH64_15660 [Terribacillus saccharophilus]
MTTYTSLRHLEQIKENYLVGVLATKEDGLPKLGFDEEAVTYSEQMNDVVFYIKPLSQEPKEITQIQEKLNMSNLYIGIGSRSLSMPVEYKYITDTSKKIDIIRKRLEGRLLLFKPVLTFQERTERYHKNIDEIIVEEEWIEGKEYLAVPRIELEPIEFEERLMSEEPISLEQYNHAMPAPSYLLCGDYIYGNIKENQLKIDSSKTHYDRVITSPSTVKRVPITQEEIHDKSGSERTKLMFLEEEFMFTTIADRLDAEGTFISDIDNDSKHLDNKIITENDVEDRDEPQRLDERAFIRDLDKIAKLKKLVYTKEDLINFHTSIKSSALTILSGQSGIGKTKLATTYAEALGLSQMKKTMLIMPISPAYTEPGDILGYLNPSTGLYMPAETGLVDFLIHAQEYENQAHMLILDEMNLSQIEHYFAPFISLLELDEKERYLHIYSKDSVCHNNQKYKPSIHLKDNLVIVGTMNTDETTKDISDRLLDRSNVVVLEKKSFQEIKSELEHTGIDIISSSLGDAYGAEYSKWKSTKNCWEAFEDAQLEFFDRLDRTISQVDPQKGFSIRNIIRMGDYLNNLPQDTNEVYSINRGRAIDLFIKQRVITKIRGPVELYEELIGTIDGNGEPTGTLYKLFNESMATEISDFHKTKIDLVRKARELSSNGYAS